MNPTTQESQPKYPNLSSPDVHQPPPYSQDPQPGPSSPTAHLKSDDKWGTHIMGTPAVPTCHPNNQKAALWAASDQYDYQNHHSPYVQYSPIERTNISPLESVLQKFNSWSHKAESTAHNIWHNLRTGPSVPGAAWGKVNLTAKAITGGGFEALYKQTFATFPNEQLKKTFACYLSTTTGPVAGTLYLSNAHIAFCSDRPLSYTAPSGQETWSYYKIGSIHPVIMRENPKERYIHAITIDGHDFWYMGFVNYEKATHHLFETVSSFAAAGIPVAQPFPAEQCH
ncbi:GEM-like protein 5 [Forsythia ovata]|uniref:GEM-like protein 5 n=1 Tax=Forsythia ovata TaxID=205694 RepID=A0ABD1NVJ1_9LAMI